MRTQRTRQSLEDIIQELNDRVRALENAKRAANTSIDNGSLTLTGGNLVVKDTSGNTVLTIRQGALPTIEMTPSSSVAQNYLLKYLGWESSTQGAALQLDVNRIENDGSTTRNGGKLLLMRDASYLSHQPDGASEAFWAAGAGGNGVLSAKGKFGDGVVADSEAAIIVGKVDIAAGVSTYTYNYATPLASTPVLTYALLNSAGAVTHSLTANSATGFTVAWSGTLAKTLYFQAFRV
jgi:hypothetical protein